MELSNMRDFKVIGQNPITWRFRATVDVTTTKRRWFRTVRTTAPRVIERIYAGTWFFVDTGGYVPGMDADRLERAYRAQHDLYH